MNTPNPLVPQGSLQEEQGKKKSQVRIVVFSILAIHVVLLGALLLQACNKPADPQTPPKVDVPAPVNDATNPPPPPPLPPPPSNSVPELPPVTPPVPTNVPPVTPPVTPDPGLTSGATEHIIQKGETFEKLAKKYGVSVNAIKQANPGVDPTKLKIKQKIAIPAKPPAGAGAPTTPSPTAADTGAAGNDVYTVKKGDNLTSIAKAHHTTPKALKALNGLKTDMIKQGQKLKVPAAAAPSTPAVPPPPPIAPPTAPVVPPISIPPPGTPTTPPPGTPAP